MVFVFEYPPSDPLATFLVQVFLTLALTRTLAKILSYVKQPRVIGEILGGIILGPSVLGNIPGFTQKIFPQLIVKNGTSTTPTMTIMSIDTFSVMANMGLVFFMFLMGMELDDNLVSKVASKAIPIAAASIMFPFGIGALSSLWWWDINNTDNGAGWAIPNKTAFILFCGTCLCLTAFPVLTAILKAGKIINTPIGALVSTRVDARNILLMARISTVCCMRGNQRCGCVVHPGYCFVILEKRQCRQR